MAKKLISVWLSATILLFSTITIFAEENVEGQFLNRNININGNTIANYYLEYPFFLYEGAAFVPLSRETGQLLGFSAEMDWESRTLKILKQEPLSKGLTEKKLKSNLDNLSATLLENVTVMQMWEEEDFPVVYNDMIAEEFIPTLRLETRNIDIGDYPLIQSGQALYLPVRAFTGENGFGWDVFYDEYSGLYISTIPGIGAKDFFDKQESDYNRGLINFILYKNKNLSPGWAAMLVFLFKHEAEVNGVDERLLMAMAQKESTFRSDAVGKNGPVGLMQIMPKTAERYGITRDELFDPHTNIEFGAKYIKDKLAQYNNNQTIALSAYNQGGLAISRGSYNTRYATKITGAQQSINQYLTNNGYGLGE
ncbi:hypothetical protein MASR2M70_20650 [Bacillota bacterium]